MKKLLVIAFICLFALVALAAPAAVAAEETCVSTYGNPVVCGITNIPTPHKPVEAGIGDINVAVLASVSLLSAFGLFVYSKLLAR